MGILVVIAVGFFSLRHLESTRRRRIHAAVVVVLALLRLVTIVGYLSDR